MKKYAKGFAEGAKHQLGTSNGHGQLAAQTVGRIGARVLWKAGRGLYRVIKNGFDAPAEDFKDGWSGEESEKPRTKKNTSSSKAK